MTDRKDLPSRDALFTWVQRAEAAESRAADLEAALREIRDDTNLDITARNMAGYALEPK